MELYCYEANFQIRTLQTGKEGTLEEKVWRTHPLNPTSTASIPFRNVYQSGCVCVCVFRRCVLD